MFLCSNFETPFKQNRTFISVFEKSTLEVVKEKLNNKTIAFRIFA